MQELNENKLRRSIKIKNTTSYIRGTVALKFLVFLIIGIIIGGAFFGSPYIDKSSFNTDAIDKHFESVFVDCETFSEMLLTVLILSELEIRYLFLIFISGFTYFCFVASGFMMLGRGFMFGFSSSCIIFMYSEASSSVTGAVLVSYLLFNVISLFILISLSVAAYIFSFDFRKIKRNHFVLRRAPIIYKYSFSLIIALGALLINNFMYCLCFYIL